MTRVLRDDLDQNHIQSQLDIGLLVLGNEGLQHIEGGVGRYLWNIIEEAPALQKEWLDRSIRLTFYAAEPICSPEIASYRQGLFARMDAALRATGGRAIRLINNSYGDPLARSWDNYLVASASAAQIALELALTHRSLIVIGGLSLYSMVPMLICKEASFVGADVTIMHMTHNPVPGSDGTVYEPELYTDAAMGQWARNDPRVKIGYESDYMRKSYQNQYSIPNEAFVFAHSGIPIDHEKFVPIDPSTIKAILLENSIPTDKQLVLTWGRNDQEKGYDLLLRAVHLLDNIVVPVVINPFYNAALHKLAEELSLDAVLLHDKPFRVISAILQWPNTKAAAFLSRIEPATVTPIEAMRVTYGSGCLVLAVPTGCYPDWIVDGQTGFLAETRSPEAVARTIRRILDLPSADAKRIEAQALAYVQTHHDFRINFRQTLKVILSPYLEQAN